MIFAVFEFWDPTGCLQTYNWELWETVLTFKDPSQQTVTPPQRLHLRTLGDQYYS